MTGEKQQNPISQWNPISIDRSANPLKPARRAVLRRLIVPALLLLLATSGCAIVGSRGDDPNELSGRMLIWHAWQGSEAEALNRIIDRYHSLHPDVDVQVRAFTSRDEMLNSFVNAAASGLGPDLLIASSRDINDLVHNHLIADIKSEVSSDLLESYAPTALTTLESGGGLYGLPESLNTMALFYNRRLTENTPADLDALLNELQNGAVFLMRTDFIDAYWGVQAFGGQLFDEEGRVILDHGGFANWLAFLRDARDAPGMIVDSNRQALRNRFTDGNAEYYVGNTSELPVLQEALGEDMVGVAVLPQGPLGPAGPFMETRAFLFSVVSSPNQRRLALSLAGFATNAEQSAGLLRDASHVPANQNVRINPRLNPRVNAIARQTRTAIPISGDERMQTALSMGADIYTQVLEGLTSPAEAATSLTQSINQANGLPVASSPAALCLDVGSINLLNTWSDARTQKLKGLVDAYRSICPGMIINVENMDAEEALGLIAEDTRALAEYDLVTGSQMLLISLADAEQIIPLDSLMDSATLQRFRPIALRAMQFNGRLYGAPAVIDINALYYNNQLSPEPLRTLSEIRAEAETGVQVALETGFVAGFWGVTAMGGTILNEDAYQLDHMRTGFIEWLTWLKELQTETPAVLTNDRAELISEFAAGKSAYLAGDLSLLNSLNESLGQTMSTAHLPDGPGGAAQSMALVDGVMVTRALNEEESARLLAFIKHLTGNAAAEWLVGPGAGLPASTTQDDLLADNALYRSFVEQARDAVHLPAITNLPALLATGDEAYRAVLEDDVEPAVAVEAVLRAFPSYTETVTATVSTTVTTTVTTTITAETTSTPQATKEP